MTADFDAGLGEGGGGAVAMDLDDPPVCLPDDGDADGGAVRWV